MTANMSSLPQVSVIIPLYNKAPYIKRALDSVSAQTVQDFEVIVVNDGSKDGGEKIVEEYGDSRIHLINQENQGVSAARNHGVDAARAELVAFLDADDEWNFDYLETIISLSLKFPEAGLYATGYFLIRNNIQMPCSYLPELGSRLLPSYFSERVRAGIQNQFIMASAFVVRKQIFQKLRGYDISISHGEDIELYERLSVISEIAYSPNICAKYYYDIPENTRTTVVNKSSSANSIINRYTVLSDSIQTANNSILLSSFRKYINMRYSTLSFQHAMWGHRKDSIILLKSVRSLKYIHLIVGALILNSLPRKIQVKLMMWHYKF